MTNHGQFISSIEVRIREREKKKNNDARCRPRLQSRAVARENKKEGSGTAATSVPLVVSRGTFLAEHDRNAEAGFTNECHLTIRLVG